MKYTVKVSRKCVRSSSLGGNWCVAPSPNTKTVTAKFLLHYCWSEPWWLYTEALSIGICRCTGAQSRPDGLCHRPPYRACDPLPPVIQLRQRRATHPSPQVRPGNGPNRTPSLLCAYSRRTSYCTAVRTPTNTPTQSGNFIVAAGATE